MDISKLNKLEDELSDMYRDLVGEGHVNDDLFSECMSDMVYEVKGAVLDEACREAGVTLSQDEKDKFWRTMEATEDGEGYVVSDTISDMAYDATKLQVRALIKDSVIDEMLDILIERVKEFVKEE